MLIRQAAPLNIGHGHMADGTVAVLTGRLHTRQIRGCFSHRRTRASSCLDIKEHLRRNPVVDSHSPGSGITSCLRPHNLLYVEYQHPKRWNTSILEMSLGRMPQRQLRCLPRQSLDPLRYLSTYCWLKSLTKNTRYILTNRFRERGF